MEALVKKERFTVWPRLTAGALLLVLWIAVFTPTILALVRLARNDEGHSHILAVPVLAAYFFYADRGKIFRSGLAGPRVQKILAGVFLACGSLLFWFAHFGTGGGGTSLDALSLSTASAVLFLVGMGLALIPEIDLTGAAFPCFLLFLLIPIPSVLREHIVTFLVQGSASLTELLFRLTGTTYYREGTYFLFKGLSIEIADECSGIRSSIGLFITLLLASHLMLRKWWSKGALLLTIVPMVLVKNAIRITTLTLLALHVDKAFLISSPLHHSGGVVFFAIALILLLPVLVLLRKLDDSGMDSGNRSGINLGGVRD